MSNLEPTQIVPSTLNCWVHKVDLALNVRLGSGQNALAYYSFYSGKRPYSSDPACEGHWSNETRWNGQGGGHRARSKTSVLISLWRREIKDSKVSPFFKVATVNGGPPVSQNSVPAAKISWCVCPFQTLSTRPQIRVFCEEPTFRDRVRLHCGENRCKMAHFEERKKYFAFLKHSNLARLSA